MASQRGYATYGATGAAAGRPGRSQRVGKDGDFRAQQREVAEVPDVAWESAFELI